MAKLTPNIVTDPQGRTYRPIICQNGHVLGHEFIFRGRLRLRCPDCDTIMVLVFRQRKRPKNQDKIST